MLNSIYIDGVQTLIKEIVDTFDLRKKKPILPEIKLLISAMFFKSYISCIEWNINNKIIQ